MITYPAPNVNHQFGQVSSLVIDIGLHVCYAQFRKGGESMSVRINRSVLKAMLGAKDKSLRDLAKESGIGEATIYRIANGSGFTSETLGALATALGCSPVDLIDPEGFVSPLMVAPTPQVQRT